MALPSDSTIDLTLSFHFLPELLPIWLPSIIFLTIGSYIAREHIQNKLGLAITTVIVLMGLVFLLEAMMSHPLHEELHNLLMRTYWALVFILQFSLFFASLLFRESESHYRCETQRKWVKYFFLPFLAANTLLTLTTSFYFRDSSLPISTHGEYTVYGLSLKYTAVIRIFYELIIYPLSIANLWIINAKPQADSFKKRSVGLTLLSVILTTIGGLIASVSYFLQGTGLLHIPYENVLDYSSKSLLLLAVISFFIGFLKFSTAIKTGSELLRNFFAYLVTLSLYTSIIGLSLYYVISASHFPNVVPMLIALVTLIPVMTCCSFNHVLRGFENLFEDKGATTRRLTSEDFLYVVKNISSPKCLLQSSLLNLKSVILRSKRFGIDREEALRDLVLESLSALKPDDNALDNRSIGTLKYEILRMIIQDQAVESQIMWDLGFQADSAFSLPTEPRYPIKKNSEYKSLSKNSYKRLRKKAFEELLWQMRLLEEKSVRLR